MSDIKKKIGNFSFVDTAAGQYAINIFFFQAEDGIRDFCLSRGLGDVYKRQLNG